MHEPQAMDGAAEEVTLGKRPVRTLVWIAGTLAFAVGLYASARFGIQHAENKVPASKLKVPTEYAVDEEATFEPSDAFPLVFATTQKELREYEFREGAEPGAGMAKAERSAIFEHRGDPVRVRILEVDADLVRVRILAGPRADATFWVRPPRSDE